MKSGTKWNVCLLTFGVISSIIALAAVAISFATDQWVNCQVRAGYGDSQASSSLYTCRYCPEMFYTRSRGLFRTCYPGSSMTWVNSYDYLKRSLIDGVCLAERGYQVSPGDPTPEDYNDQAGSYRMRRDMMRAHWSLFVCAIVLLLISSMVGAVGCWRENYRVLQATAIFLLLAVCCIAAGMILFHAYYSLENTKITQAPLMGLVLISSSYTDLRSATSCAYGYSYALGWVALVFSFIAMCLFISVVIILWMKFRPVEDEVHVQSMPTALPAGPLPTPHKCFPTPPPPNPTYTFFDRIAHHTPEPTTYPIPFDPYDLHLPTGLPSDGQLKLPRYHQQFSSPGKFDTPMLHSKLPVNYGFYTK